MITLTFFRSNFFLSMFKEFLFNCVFRKLETTVCYTAICLVWSESFGGVGKRLSTLKVLEKDFDANHSDNLSRAFIFRF